MKITQEMINSYKQDFPTYTDEEIRDMLISAYLYAAISNYETINQL